jgi:ABC-type lipoprotein release transport system permease subunit
VSTFAFLTFFLIVVGIPVIGVFVSKMHKANIELEKKKLETLGHQTAEKAAQYAAHTERLEQRVRVLERIITDKGFDVSMQIEELRSEPETKELN